jgi:hypothetical protein
VDDDHGVLAPRLAARAVAQTAPEVDDFLAILVDATRAPELAPTSKVLDERLPHRLESLAHRAFDEELLRCCHVFALPSGSLPQPRYSILVFDPGRRRGPDHLDPEP